jgi:hypothetical protein
VVDKSGTPEEVRYHRSDPFCPEDVAMFESRGYTIVDYVLPPTWTPVNSGPPEPGNYLCEFDSARGPRSCAVAELGTDGVWRDEDGNTCGPTHWMPLPEPPR